MVAGALCRLATRFLLLYGRTLGAMQLMQVFYGVGIASEVVFNAYVFALVVRKTHAKHTQNTPKNRCKRGAN